MAQPVTTTYTFATAGYTPLGLNFLSRKAAPPQAGVRKPAVVLMLTCALHTAVDVHDLRTSCKFDIVNKILGAPFLIHGL